MVFGTWLAIYFIVWWLTLFVVLPFGVRSQHEAGEVPPGSEPGAPAKMNTLRIFGMTTLVALVIQAGIWWLVNNYWID